MVNKIQKSYKETLTAPNQFLHAKTRATYSDRKSLNLGICRFYHLEREERKEMGKLGL